MADSIRAALERLVNAVDVYDATGMDVLDDAIAAARAALAEQQGEGPTTDWKALCVELLAALENAIRVVYHEDGTQHISTADSVIAKADAALVSDGPAVPEGREPASVMGKPSDEQLCDLWSWAAAQDHGPWPTQQHCFARAVLARWGHQPAPHDDRGVLPMVISDTGASDEPERERIICASISGGADYINNMPRMLILERIELHKGSICRRYIQEPTPPAEGERRWTEGICGDGAAILFDGVMVPVHEVVRALNCHRSQPPAEGEVAELLAELEVAAVTVESEGGDHEAAAVRRAAELLQQQHPTPVPVSQRLPELEDCDGEGRCWWGAPALFGTCTGDIPHSWRLCRPDDRFNSELVWLPATALPLPQGEVQP